MLVGIPTETKNNEFRVAITPAGVAELTHRGHEVLVQAGAGLDQYLVAPVGQFRDAGRGDGHSEFVVFGLGWNTDAHASSVKKVRKRRKQADDNSVGSCRA